MSINYSTEIYKIIDIKKNSISVSLLNDDKKIYHNIKKKYVQIILKDDNFLNPITSEKEEVEKIHKVKSKLQKEGLKPDYIILEKNEQMLENTIQKKFIKLILI